MLLACDGSKACTKCKKIKALTEFTKGPDNGYRYQCRVCNMKYQQGNPAKRAATHQRYYKKAKQENPALFMWKTARHRAIYDYGGMEFSIEASDIFIPEVCPYLQVPFIPLDKKYAYSLDRIDSSKGYTKENIQVISRLANIMKNNATEQELVSFAKGVLAVHTKEDGCDVISL